MEIRAGANLGRYQLLAEIGRGAMGMVYQALDPEIDRIVAIKTYSELDSTSTDSIQFRDRFAQEARAAGRLTHPGIVAIYDRGEEPEHQIPYIVMEYVAGHPLSALLNNHSARLEEKFALQIAREVAEALAYAHERGVVHRDIKPSNILITEEGNAKIADFGVARLDTSNLTFHGEVIGTPAYMSPEQLTGNEVDGRSDIFSLGVILYTMLSGFRPFQGNGASTIGFKVVNQQPMPITNYHLDLSKDTEYVVARAMAKNPGERYATGIAMAADLTDILEGREPRSRRESSVPVSAHVERVAKDYRPFLAAVMPKAEQAQSPKPKALTTAAAAAAQPAPLTMASPTIIAPYELTPPPRRVPRVGGKGRLFALAIVFVAVAAAWLVHSSRAQLRANNDRLLKAATAPAPTNLEAKKEAGNTQASVPLVKPAAALKAAPEPSKAVSVAKAVPPKSPASSLDKTVVHAQPAVAPTNTANPVPPAAANSTWRDPLAAKQPATLELALEHHFKEAAISVWVDNKLTFSGVSHGEAHKRLFLLHGAVEGKESHEVRFPAGEHSIKVRVTSSDPGYDNSGSIESTFLDSQRSVLEIRCNKRGIELKLTDGS